MIGNTLIDVESDEAFSEVLSPQLIEAGFDDLIVAGRYLDRYERRDGVWKMAYARSVSTGVEPRRHKTRTIK